jgi:hypothetical protein
MSNDPMVRGDAAPAGFASSVSGFLQAYVAQQRLEHPGASMNTRARHNVLDGCSSAPVAAGDDDPRIRVLALASPGPRWNPGPQQLAAVHGAGHKPGSLSGEANDKLTGDKLLNALALGAALDLQTLHAREVSQVRKGPEAAPSQEALVSYERERADNAERELRQLRIERETASADYRRERDQRRHLQAILRNTGELPAESNGGKPDEPERQRLPAGVRQRGSTFQAFWRGASGRQEQQGGFATAEEAKAHRTAEMERVAKERQTTTGPEMSAGPPPEFNPSPEELAAMQEEATR